MLLDGESKTLSTTGLFVVDDSTAPAAKIRKVTMLPKLRLLGQKVLEKRAAARREMTGIGGHTGEKGNI